MELHLQPTPMARVLRPTCQRVLFRCKCQGARQQSLDLAIVEQRPELGAEEARRQWAKLNSHVQTAQHSMYHAQRQAATQGPPAGGRRLAASPLVAAQCCWQHPKRTAPALGTRPPHLQLV